VEGYMVSFVAFYERGFGVSPHRFLCSRLQHYHLELHNMTRLGILHIATFMTLCEAYMGLTLTLTMCGDRCLQDLNLEITILGGVVIHVMFEQGVDPYFDIPMPK
jgi:hypothetical protein